MVKNIKQLCDKLKIRERKRIESGKEITGAYALLINALTTINNQSSSVFHDFSYEKGFCSGFLNGLLSCNYITKEEFHILDSELSSVGKSEKNEY